MTTTTAHNPPVHSISVHYAGDRLDKTGAPEASCDACDRRWHGRSLHNRDACGARPIFGAPLDEHLTSIEELAAYLRIPVSTIYGWRRTGQGPAAMKVGRHLRYDRAEFSRWLTTLSKYEAGGLMGHIRKWSKHRRRVLGGTSVRAIPGTDT
ncbi:MAG TPA: helix-turn-helix domain-containing protein [Actinomycetota bacterium]|nr:helix-turn-helix domain-containing protein [Actinomycetota bacterium]